MFAVLRRDQLPIAYTLVEASKEAGTGFLGPMSRAWLAQAKIKGRLIGNLDPEDWDFPPKPKWMRWATYKRLEARFDVHEDAKDAHLLRAGAE